MKKEKKKRQKKGKKEKQKSYNERNFGNVFFSIVTIIFMAAAIINIADITNKVSKNKNSNKITGMVSENVHLHSEKIKKEKEFENKLTATIGQAMWTMMSYLLGNFAYPYISDKCKEDWESSNPESSNPSFNNAGGYNGVNGGSKSNTANPAEKVKNEEKAPVGFAEGTKFKAEKVFEHSPGFFSCQGYNGRIFLGTYQRKGERKAELLELGKGIIHVFDGESVYHIRKYGDTLYLPIEQGDLFAYKPGGKPTRILKHRYKMGFYDFVMSNYGWFSMEKDNVNPPNKFKVYNNGKEFYTTTKWKSKELAVLGDELFFSASGVDNHKASGLISINVKTKQEKRYKVVEGTWAGGLAVHKGKVYFAICAPANEVVTNTGDIYKIDIQPATLKEIGGVLYLTSMQGWRAGHGPSFLYRFNDKANRFEKILQLPDAEMWDICSNGNNMFVVTRNQKGNVGRVYKISPA